MRFLLTPVGSAGDVNPFVGIGGRLRGRGHDVVLAAPAPFRDLAERAGLRFVSSWSAEDYERTTLEADLWHARKGLRVVFQAVTTTMRVAYDQLQALYQPGTILVGHTLSLATRLLEEVTGAPGATVHLAPSLLRSEHEAPALRVRAQPARWPRWWNRALWRLVDYAVLDPLFAPPLNAWRRELGLPQVHRVFNGWIHSPQRVIGLFPDWFAPPQPDWPPQTRLTGFPLFDDVNDGPLDPTIERFLDDGERPVVFTAGTANRHARGFFETAVAVCGRIGTRGILAAAHRDQIPRDLPPTVLAIDYVPFSQLLPRAAAIVHHGGIGTTSQGLAAGIPQLIMPMAFDQPDNATRLGRLGVGAWLRPRHFTPQRVAAVLTDLLARAEVGDACRRCAARIAESDALSATCDALERLG